MKRRILGWTCVISLAVGCQSPSTKALSRWKKSEKDSVQTASDSTNATQRGAGLPQPSQRQNAASAAPRSSFAAGEIALDDHIRSPNPARLDDARRQFELASQSDPGSAPAHHRLGIVADLQAQQALDANRPQEAANLFDSAQSHYLTAMSLDPANANIPADLGYSSILQGRWAAAEQYLGKALAMNPSHDKAVKHLAYVYGQGGRSQLAEQTLTRVMSRDDARAELAAMFPDSGSEQQNGGTSDRFNNRNDPQITSQERLMADVQRAGLETAQARQQTQPAQQASFAQQGYAGSNVPNAIPPGNWPMPNGQPQGGEGEALRNQLAAVDHAGRPDPSVPMVVGRPGRIAGPPETAGRTDPGRPAVPSATPGWNEQPANATSPYYGSGAANDADVPPTITPQSRSSNGLAQIYGGGREMNPLRNKLPSEEAPVDDRDIRANDDPRVNPLAAGQSIPATGLAARQNPLWPNAAQGSAQASALAAGSDSTGPTGLAANGSTGNAALANDAASQASFEQARRSAALMGLGIGTGQMFSTLEHQANRMTPGSNGQFNGSSFPQPVRDLPDMRTPPDLRQAPSFFQQSQAAPPPNNLGQQMPAPTANMSAASQWSNGSPSAEAGNAWPPAVPAGEGVRNVQWPVAPATNELAGYDDTRQQVDQTVQHSMSAWANSPAQAIATPSAGVPFQQPPAPAQQMEAWNRRPVTPEQYPNSPQQRSGSLNVETITLPTVTPVSGYPTPMDASRYAPATRRSVTPTYRDGVVVPEQYQRYR
jgi:hypothetical protein